MPQPFAIETRLSAEHFAEFRQLILTRAFTTAIAMEWLTARGYLISHGSVANYMRFARAQGLFPLRPLAGLRDDEDTRRQLAVWAKELEGDDLTSLALYAAFRLNISAARRGVRPADFPATTPMRSKGD